MGRAERRSGSARLADGNARRSGIARALGAISGRGSRSDVTHERLDDLMRSANAIFWEYDFTTGEILAATGRVEELTGRRPDELRGMELGELLHPVDAAVFTAQVAALAGSGEEGTVSTSGRLPHADGSWVWLRHLARVHPQRTRTIIRGVSFDITELEQARKALVQYQDIVDGLHAAVIVGRLVDHDDPLSFTVQRANPACLAILGIDPEQLAGQRLTEMLPMLELGDLGDSLVAASRDRRSQGPVEIRPRMRGPEVVEVETVKLPGDALALVMSDVSLRAASERLIRHQAEHDGLTDLANRTRFVADLSERCAGSDPFALMLIDLDRFKDVNDTLGHHFGDELLRWIARRVGEQCREGDTVARLGGDEFAVLTNNPTFGGAIDLARRLAGACGEPVEIQGLRLAVKASVGVVVSPLHGRDPKTLLRRADLAMYAAKRSATSVRVFEREREGDTTARLALISEIPRGIEQDEFHLWLQPKVDMATLDVVGAEGLLRWHHPEHGVLAPGAFLDLLDVSGQMNRVTQLVLGQGAAHAARFRRLGRDVPIAINLAARSLCDDALPSLVDDTLRSFDLPPEMLVLEITETDVMEELPSTRHVLDRLGQAGIKLGIDDFGTGYSSLTRLRQLPVSEIKIDRSFVMQMLDDDSDAVIVRSIIELAHNLGLRAVAEGVERRDVHERLRAWGCDSAQGYLYGRPCHVDDFEHELFGDQWRAWCTETR
ncbi:MAG: EAL domain-containing protein [Acidimicrobiales bacterium]|nr:EAL domain-containing protein [Acidimicrobiales bacterium]